MNTPDSHCRCRSHLALEVGAEISPRRRDKPSDLGCLGSLIQRTRGVAPCPRKTWEPTKHSAKPSKPSKPSSFGGLRIDSDTNRLKLIYPSSPYPPRISSDEGFRKLQNKNVAWRNGLVCSMCFVVQLAYNYSCSTQVHFLQLTFLSSPPFRLIN